MILNARQKEFIEKINQPLDSKDRLKDINSFFELFCYIKENLEGFPWVTGWGKTRDLDFIDPNIFRIKNEYGNASLTLNNKAITFTDTAKVFSETLYFVELIVALEENKLIAFIDKEPNEIKHFKVPVFEDTITVGVHEWHPPFYKLWILIKEFVLVEIIPLPDLNDFIDNDYKKTTHEIEKDNEEKHRSRSLKWTIFIALASILLSISTVAFNYFTYQNERVVSIQNQKDTVRIILLDTLKENK